MPTEIQKEVQKQLSLRNLSFPVPPIHGRTFSAKNIKELETNMNEVHQYAKKVGNVVDFKVYYHLRAYYLLNSEIIGYAPYGYF